MNRSIPAPAAHILEFIYKTETGRDPPECYDVVYGQRQGELPKPLTEMTFDEVVKGGPERSRKFGSSAAGAGQFMRDTLDAPKTEGDLKGQFGLTGRELFDADLQDRMAYHLLKRRGYEKFITGQIGIVAFAKALAQEWASFPVLTSTQGAHRKVARGETFYAGDKLNKALIKPEQVEKLLQDALDIADRGEPVIEPVPTNSAITDAATVTQVQARLKELGYTEVGDIDGKVGKMTKTAILAFRNENDLPLVDYIDQDMRIALLDAKPRDIAQGRVEAKPAEVREKVPEAKAAWLTGIGAWVLGIPSAIGAVASGILDNLDGARGYLEPVKQFAGDIPPWLWFAAAGGAAFFIWHNAQKAKKASEDAFKTGERR